MRGKQRILIVDDEPQIIRVLKTGLGGRGYEVKTASNVADALEEFRAWGPDLVVTDLAMPGADGVSLCRAIRAESRVPVIVLSVRDEEQTKVETLDAGADDYITKPFGFDELLARIRVVLRRSSPVGAHREEIIEAGDFRVDVGGHTTTVQGRHVRLTPKEFELLVYFAENRGRVVTHEAVLESVWGAGYSSQVEYLRVFVDQLRKKIEPDASRPRYIVTEPCIGYYFEPGA